MKSPNKPAPKAPDIRREKIQERYTFIGEELVELGRVVGREQRVRDGLESEVSSIKEDYTGKIEAAEMRRDCAFSKLSDGFEMREVDAVVEFNRPKKGMKTYYEYLPGDADVRGGEIRTEPMTASDMQKELGLQDDGSGETDKAPLQLAAPANIQMPDIEV